MRKYYYYVYSSNYEMANGICYSDSGEFELLGIMEELKKEHNKWFIINFWHEISQKQYENLLKNFDNQTN